MRKAGAYAFLLIPRIFLPYLTRRNGMGMKTIASPPRREEAPGTPSLAYTEFPGCQR